MTINKEPKRYKEMRPAFGVQQAVDAIKSGDYNIYNAVNGTLVIADVVSGDHDDTEYDGGFRADNGEWLYGVMYTSISPEDIPDILKRYETITEYALAEIPAPGTCASGRMRFVPADSPDDLREFFTELFKEEPNGWTRQH